MHVKEKVEVDRRSAKTDLVFVFKWSKTITRSAGVETDDVGEGAKPSSSSKPVKTRSFLHTWTKTYSWLRYDQNDDFMFCEVCTGKNKKNGLTKDTKCRNFQNSTLTVYKTRGTTRTPNGFAKASTPRTYQGSSRKSGLTTRQSS